MGKNFRKGKKQEGDGGKLIYCNKNFMYPYIIQFEKLMSEKKKPYGVLVGKFGQFIHSKVR